MKNERKIQSKNDLEAVLGELSATEQLLPIVGEHIPALAVTALGGLAKQAKSTLAIMQR